MMDIKDLKTRITTKLTQLENLLTQNGFKELEWIDMGKSFRCKIICGDQISTGKLAARLREERKIAQNRVINRQQPITGFEKHMLDVGLLVMSEKPPEGVLVPRKTDAQERIEQYIGNEFYQHFDIPVISTSLEKLDRTIAHIESIVANPKTDLRKLRFSFTDSNISRN